MPIHWPIVCACFLALAELSSVAETVWSAELKIITILPFTETFVLPAVLPALEFCILKKNFTVDKSSGEVGRSGRREVISVGWDVRCSGSAHKPWNQTYLGSNPSSVTY